MQKATPLVLVVALAASATYFSLRSKPAPPADPARAPVAATQEPLDPPTTKTDTAVSLTEPRPWPQEASDIPADEGATYGTLENGMRFIIYPNSEPPTRVSLRLHIAAGSLMEEEDQRGLAHFLEHMVFNGSKNFTAAELIPRMQRLGISFGAHANAYTSFDETVYMLDLPDLSEENLNLGFTVMRDFGDGALLEIEEIDRERGVILSEKISRDTVGYRLMEKQFAELLPGSLLTQRFPIGTEEVIKNAQRERFLDFYTRYYTPERMTFIVVGDVEPAEIEERIRKTFGTMTNPSKPGGNPELGDVKIPEGLEAAVFADKEITSTDVSLMLVRPHTEKPDTAANRAERMPLNIAHAMIGRRFGRLAEQENSPIASGSASRSELFNYLELGSIDVTATDDRWMEAVPVLEQEFRRALEHGFTEAELAEAKANLLNAYEQAVKQKPTRDSKGIATVLVGSINDGRVFSEPETDLELARKALDAIDAKASHEALKAFWDVPGMHLILTTKEEPENARIELAALFEESRGKPVDPPAARELAPFGYTDFGKPGTVLSRTEVEDLGITQLVLSNQVRVNLKPTDFDKNVITLSARTGSGKLAMPKGKPMFDAFANAVFEGGGLGKHSNDDLAQILAGRNVGSSLGIDEDSITLSGSTTPADFLLQSQVMCATLTDPGYRNEGLWQFQKAIPMLFQQLKHTPAGPQQEMNAWLHGGDERFTTATLTQLSGYTLADAKAWLTPQLTEDYLELSIVGDFQIDEILPHLLATFGALPPRAKTPPDLDALRKVDFPNAPAEKVFTYDSKIEQAVAIALWQTGGVLGNQKEMRRLNLLSSIYGDRLREEIREKLGASYSPNAGVSGSEALEDFGYLVGQSVGKPEDLDLLLKTMRDLADTLATEGATADELDRAIKPTLGELEQTLRQNSYWLGTVLSKSQQDPERLELARNREADYKSITLEEINELAKRYFKAESALLVSIKPASPGE